MAKSFDKKSYGNVHGEGGPCKPGDRPVKGYGKGGSYKPAVKPGNRPVKGAPSFSVPNDSGKGR